MTQLQLYTTKNQRGLANLVNINSSEDVERYVHDFTPMLKNLRYNPAERQYVILLKFIDAGMLLTVLRPFEGGEYSYYAASLLVPAGVRIPAREYLTLIGSMKEFIHHGDPSADDVEDMRHLLEKEYKVYKDLPLRQVSSGNQYAVVMYGEGLPSLEDYAAADFYQPEYSDYSGVALLDTGGMARGNVDTTDITKPKLERLVRVNPPEKYPYGFIPQIGRRSFTSPIWAREGSTLKINWQKSGFETVSEQFKVEGDGCVPPVPDKSLWRRIISPSTFYISEEHGQKQSKSNFSIKVNGIEVNVPKAFSLTDLENARVEISAPGYMAFSGHYDLTSTTQVLVQMHMQHRTYRFDLPIITPEESEPVRIYIKSKKALDNCPVEGYAVADGKIVEGSGISNRLVYIGGRSRMVYNMLAVALAMGLIIGLVTGWLCFR